ncbi:NADP-dependent oxidoreductase [Streptomyces sp. ID38640]|uniref:NADP-dependent oxidoreductase n=1 Tax=Streptomyces sp. ID38640 TaxID=1265399 RepID=UPI00140F176B|nr:NADP-dependent oxidoreductase [Streptomyces sp. ID38640]QIK05823.1 NADP-dependent oxidoreductase [Streptomyces sp. ID38640]
MKAVRYHSYGGSDVLVYEEADRPAPGVGQVVVQVAGTSYNDADSGLRAGLRQDLLPLAFPHIPGLDLAGVISAVGEGVSDWRVGDAVVALLPADAPGAAAEYVAVSAEALATAPRTVELADAAALPLVGLTAWQVLFEHADLKTGQNILINGAGSAVGGYAVQLAAQAGATVTATAGARSRDRVRSYGADRIVDYAVIPVVQALAGQHFDMVLQLAPAGPEENAQLVDLVADGGAFVSVTTPGPQDAGRGVRTVHVFGRSDATQLADLVARVDAGDLAIEVAERLPLADLATVHARAAGRFAQIAELAARVEGGDLAKRLRADRAAVHAPAAAGELAGKTILTP